MMSACLLESFIPKHASATPRHDTHGLHRNKFCRGEYIKTL